MLLASGVEAGGPAEQPLAHRMAGPWASSPPSPWCELHPGVSQLLQRTGESNIRRPGRDPKCIMRGGNAAVGAAACRAGHTPGALCVGVHSAWPCGAGMGELGPGQGNPLQCSCLENPRDGGAWWAAVYGITQSPTRLKRHSSSSRALDNEIGRAHV